MIGNISPGYAQIASVPIGADTSTFNVTPGTRVMDSANLATYQKISPLGDNTKYIPGGVDMAWNENFLNYATTDTIAILTATGLVRATTANLLHQIYTPGGLVYGNCNLGTQTLPPTIVADGLDIGGDQTNAEGYEVFSHFAGATGRPFCVGKDPAFFFYAKIKIGDVSGTDTMLVGFRAAEVNNGTLANYSSYVGMGFNTSAAAAAIKLIGEVANAAPATYPVDTTQTIADATSWGIKVMVSATGVVTFTHDAAVPGTLAAPTAIGTSPTLTSGMLVVPFIHFLNSSDLVDSFVIQQWVTGYSLL
jgi:hypothetical protein